MAKETEIGVWVLTQDFNDYDQHGSYFCAVWSKKPTTEKLAEFFGHTASGWVVGSAQDALHFLLHLENGGGRRGTEGNWYNLEFVKFGDDKMGVK